MTARHCPVTADDMIATLTASLIAERAKVLRPVERPSDQLIVPCPTCNAHRILVRALLEERGDVRCSECMARRPEPPTPVFVWRGTKGGRR